MPNKYGKAVAYLTANPSQITMAFLHPKLPGGELFKWLPIGMAGERSVCPILLRINHRNSWKGSYKIVRDTRLPTSLNRIKAKHLRILADWQRKVDRVAKARGITW